MFTEEYGAVAAAAVGKIALLKKNPVGYFLSAFLAGMFIGFGVLLAFTVGGILTGEIYGKIVMGATFGVALSLVVMAGAELFTGNNFVITAGMLHKTARVRDGLLLWQFNGRGNPCASLPRYGAGARYRRGNFYGGFRSNENDASLLGTALPRGAVQCARMPCGVVRFSV